MKKRSKPVVDRETSENAINEDSGSECVESQTEKEEDSSEKESSHHEQKGIYKLFDLMKMDLGEHQTCEMKNFYEKMST